MITIDGIIEYFEQDFFSVGTWAWNDMKEAAAVVRAQREDIKRLRAANKDALAWFDKVRRERDEAYDAAAKVVETARMLGCTMDGIEDAIRALKSGEPK